MPAKIETTSEGGGQVVTVVGAIDEEIAAVLPAFSAKLGKTVSFNLRDVDYINSSGVRLWVLFLREFTVGRKVSYDECSPTMLSQITMIPGLLTGVTMNSILLSYRCSHCNRAELMRLAAAQFPAAGQMPAPTLCPSCGVTMHIGDNGDEWLGFLADK